MLLRLKDSTKRHLAAGTSCLLQRQISMKLHEFHTQQHLLRNLHAQLSRHRAHRPHTYVSVCITDILSIIHLHTYIHTLWYIHTSYTFIYIHTYIHRASKIRTNTQANLRISLHILVHCTQGYSVQYAEIGCVFVRILIPCAVRTTQFIHKRLPSWKSMSTFLKSPRFRSSVY